jgi:hypothetical protein
LRRRRGSLRPAVEKDLAAVDREPRQGLIRGEGAERLALGATDPSSSLYGDIQAVAGCDHDHPGLLSTDRQPGDLAERLEPAGDLRHEHRALLEANDFFRALAVESENDASGRPDRGKDRPPSAARRDRRDGVDSRRDALLREGVGHHPALPCEIGVPSICCSAQPPQVPKWRQRGATRSGLAETTFSGRPRAPARSISIVSPGSA